jgi:hypothetical protein
MFSLLPLELRRELLKFYPKEYHFLLLDIDAFDPVLNKAWLRKYIWQFRVDFCNAAARDGYLNLLKYSFKNKFRWTKQTFQNAVKNNKRKCINYLLKRGCPQDSENPITTKIERPIKKVICGKCIRRRSNHIKIKNSGIFYKGRQIDITRLVYLDSEQKTK